MISEISRQTDNTQLQALAQQRDPARCHFGAQVSHELKLAAEIFHVDLAKLSHNLVLQHFIADINQKIRGETSDLLSDRVARRMLRRHTKARLVEVPGIGHAPLLNEPVVIASLRPFLLNLFAAEQEDTHVRRA